MIRDVLDVYNRHIMNILLLCVCLVIPVTFFLFFTISYFYEAETVELSNLTALFFMILNFTLLCPPFLTLAWKDYHDEEIQLSDLLKSFVNHFGYIALMTLFLYFICLAGSFLLFIPTIIAVAMLLLFPLFTNESDLKESLQKVWNTIKNEHILIYIDLLIIGSLNVLVWSGLTYLMQGFENNQFAYISLRAIINSLLLPFIYFYLTIKYRFHSLKENLGVYSRE